MAKVKTIDWKSMKDDELEQKSMELDEQRVNIRAEMHAVQAAKERREVDGEVADERLQTLAEQMDAVVKEMHNGQKEWTERTKDNVLPEGGHTISVEGQGITSAEQVGTLGGK